MDPYIQGQCTRWQQASQSQTLALFWRVRCALVDQWVQGLWQTKREMLGVS